MKIMSNPAKRRTRRKPAPRKTTRRTTVARKAAPRRKSNPARRRTTMRRRTYKRNPARMRFNMRRIVEAQLKPALMGAVGAVGIDMLYGNLMANFLPAQLTTGMGRHATKGAIAVGASVVVGGFMGSKRANEMAVGSLTVTMRDAIREFLATAAPTLPLGDYDGMGYYSPGMVGAFDNSLMHQPSDLGAFDNSLSVNNYSSSDVGYN